MIPAELSDSVIAVLLFSGLVLSAVGACLAAFHLTVRLRAWALRREGRLPLVSLMAVIVLCVLLPVGRTASAVGAAAGLLYLLAERYESQLLTRAVAWLSLATGGLVATGGFTLCQGQPGLLLAAVGWGFGSVLAGAVLLHRPVAGENPADSQASAASQP